MLVFKFNECQKNTRQFLEGLEKINEREREKERDRQRDKETQRHTERERQREMQVCPLTKGEIVYEVYETVAINFE